MISIMQKKIIHVNDHLTPLAILIVVPGLLVAQMPLSVRVCGGILIIWSLTVNYVTANVLGHHSGALAKFRVGSNYVVNIALLWMLYVPWPIIWTLFLLTAYGLAVYQSRRDALRSAVMIALLLLVVHGAMGVWSIAEWVLVGIKAAIIVISAPFVNGLLALAAPRP